MSNPDRFCFYTEIGDTNSFGSSLAINDKYMAVGDPNANRAVIYQRDCQKHWHRSHVIYPPENSPAFKVGKGFGRISGLNENVLMVDSIIKKASTPFNSVNSNSFKDFPIKDIRNRQRLFKKYIFDLDLKLQITQIDCMRNNQKEFTNFYILHNREVKQVNLQNHNEEMFGVSTAIHSNLMLVGSPPSRQRNLAPKQGRGWLFDLNKLDSSPKLITAEKAYLGKRVALTSQFAVIGNRSNEQLIRSYGLYPKTLIMSLNNDSYSLIDSQGYLSIHKNILAVMRPRADMQSPLLQLFRIDEHSVPSLILERKILDSYQIVKGRYLRNALVQNGWLLTIERLGKQNSLKICLDSIKQIIISQII
ncbi:MAG: hypothetical protein ACFCAD_02840 [Pleurocapsa sp.]